MLAFICCATAAVQQIAGNDAQLRGENSCGLHGFLAWQARRWFRGARLSSTGRGEHDRLSWLGSRLLTTIQPKTFLMLTNTDHQLLPASPALQ